MIKKIALSIVALVVLVLAVGMLLPRNVHVERTITILAPRATVFALVDGFKSFSKWSPWAEKDPNATYAFSGPDFGAGAKMSWTGDPKKVGSGSQEILEAKPFDAVTSQLDFGPQGKAVARFSLAPDGGGTKVTWRLDSDMGAGPVGRWFGLVMDRMIGPDFEHGLANLKRYAESLPKADFTDLAVEKVEAVPITVAYVSATSSHDTKEIGAAIGAAYAKVGAFMKQHGLKSAGAPLTIDTSRDDAHYGFEAAIPVDGAPSEEVPAGSAVQVKTTYGGPALKVTMKGPYAGMDAIEAKLAAYIAARGYETSAPSWDEYVSDPGSTPEEKLVTNIYQPIK
jgi:effector-binding domain-containing protein